MTLNPKFKLFKLMTKILLIGNKQESFVDISSILQNENYDIYTLTDINQFSELTQKIHINDNMYDIF